VLLAFYPSTTDFGSKGSQKVSQNRIHGALWFILLVLQTAFARALPCGKSKAMAGDSITQAKVNQITPGLATEEDQPNVLLTFRPLSEVAGSSLATKTQLAMPPAVKR